VHHRYLASEFVREQSGVVSGGQVVLEHAERRALERLRQD